MLSIGKGSLLADPEWGKLVACVARARPASERSAEAVRAAGKPGDPKDTAVFQLAALGRVR